MSLTTNKPWLRVTRNRPCAVCNKTDWCSISADGAVAICMRVEAGSIKRTRNGGFLHRLGNAAPTSRVIHRTFSLHTLTDQRFRELAPKYRTAVNPDRLELLASALGVSSASLSRLDIGWAVDRGAWSFPMRLANGNVCGFRLRGNDGRKWAEPGSREGLFIPDDLPDASRLLVTEGPTDCAALLDLSFAAVGRPSCTGGVGLLVALARHRKSDDVIIVADSDGPGRRGAGNLASVLRAYVPSVRIIKPPDGLKDARAWKQAGTTAVEIQAAIDAAIPFSLAINVRRTDRKR